jgi:hypothetical protein
MLYLETSAILTEGMFLSYLCYTSFFFAVLLFRYFSSSKARVDGRFQRSFRHVFLEIISIDVQLLVLALWLLFSSPILCITQHYLPFLLVYVLILFVNAVSLRLIVEKFKKGQKDGHFMQGMIGGLLILCSSILMSNSIYNLLIFSSILSITSPLLYVLSYGLPLVWIVIEMVVEELLIKKWLLKVALAR